MISFQLFLVRIGHTDFQKHRQRVNGSFIDITYNFLKTIRKSYSL